MNLVQNFREYRAKKNKIILDEDTLFFKRFYNLDNRVYEHGAVSSQTLKMFCNCY